MINILKLNNNKANFVLNKSKFYLLRIIHSFGTTSTSKIIIDAHQSCFDQKDIVNSKKLFSKYTNDLRSCIFSKQEAACALRFCLDLEYFDPVLFRNLIKVLEDEYFKPLVVEDSTDTSHHLYNIAKKNVSNTYEFINSLSIKDKSNIIIWSWNINKEVKKSTRRIKIHKPTEDIDPEKKEVFVTRKTGMVLDPIPIRAILSYVPPGKKLSNTLSFQLRESVYNCTISELCCISHIFSTPLPLTGQLNEDTMDLIAARFCKYDIADLSKNIYAISAFCRYAAKRFFDIWSFMDPNVNRLPSRGKVLYKYEKRKLDRNFVLRVLDCIEEYANSTIKLENYKSYVKVTSDMSVHLRILNNFANSDVEISVNTWEKLMVKTYDIMKTFNRIELKEIGMFCDTVLKVKYTTPTTMECAKTMLDSFTISEELENEDYFLVSQLLNFIFVNGLNQESKEIIRCVYTLTLNNMERIELDNKLPLIKYLCKLSEILNESERLELSEINSELIKEDCIVKM